MQQTYAAEFDPEEVEKVLSIELSKEENDAHTKKLKLQLERIKNVYGRMQEKIKEIRQNFSTAVVNGRRSGSGKIVFQHYAMLGKFYRGTASSEPILQSQNVLNATDEILDEHSSVDVSTATSEPVNKRKP